MHSKEAIRLRSTLARRLAGLCWSLAWLAFIALPATAASGLLKVGPNQHFLVDQNEQPVLVHADAPWSLIAALTQEETTQYLDDRQSKGFNAVLCNLLEHYWMGGDNPYQAPTNRYGEPPFLVPGDFTTPNEAYFSHADWVIQRAAETGMTVLLTPCYAGYPGTSQGWYEEILQNGEAKCRQYGRWLGARYKNSSNVVWVMYADRNPDDSAPMIEAMVAGMREQDTGHLYTAHFQRGNSARRFLDGSEWLTLNTAYTGDIVYPQCLTEYNRTPAMPVVLIEARYENEAGMTPPDLRREAYSALLSGACGHFFGNNPIYGFDEGWQSALDGEGSKSMVHVKELFDSRAWQELRPDDAHEVVTAGYGSDAMYVATARTGDGATVLAYLPETASAITVDLAQVSGADARAWWFNPRNGTARLVGLFPTTGSQVFSSPDTQDWILVLDNAALSLPAPGIATNNVPPAVNAGLDQNVLWPENSVELDAVVTDDGKPNPPGAVAVAWTLQSGPGDVTFTPANTVVDPTVTFSESGSYLLRLTATDGELTNFDEVKTTLAANEPPNPPGSLLCEGQVNPVGVTTLIPRFAWTFSDSDLGDSQSACRLEVRDSSDALVWDSGKIQTISNTVSYSGDPLLAGRSYTWRVVVWDGFDVASSFSVAAAFTLLKRTGELLVNGGFESGDGTGWTNGGGGSVKVGLKPPYGVSPHTGNYQAYWTSSSSAYDAFQNVDLSAYAALIDARQVTVSATGWLICGDYKASPPYDQFFMQVRFMDGNGAELISGRFDTGTKNVPTWAEYGLEGQLIPPLTRALQIRFNVWENGWDAGSADDFSVEVFLPSSLSVLTSSLLDGQTGTNYALQLEAEGGLAPYSWSLAPGSDPLPDGLQLSSSGLLSGTPASLGAFSLSIQVTDSLNRSAYRTMQLNVAAGPLNILTPSVPFGKRKVPYSAQLSAVGGEAPYRWVLVSAPSTLPTGIMLGTNGLLSGISSNLGLFSFTAEVSDQLGLVDQKGFDLAISPMGITLATYPQTADDIAASGFNFLLSADAPGSFVIDRSQDLSIWSVLQAIDYTSGSTNLVDTNVGLSSPWFYRARHP